MKTSTHSGDLLSIFHHLAIIICVIIDLFPDGLVLGKKPLSVSKRGRDVLGSHVCLRLGQPGLEVVHGAEETVKVTGLFQLGVALLELVGN